MAVPLYVIIFYWLILKTEQISLEIRTGEEYRLPSLYSPQTYRIDISVTREALTETSNEFSGKVEIQFSLENSTNFIALHAHHEFITINRIMLNNTEVASEYYYVDNITDILRINATSEMSAEEIYSVIIEYSGILSTTEMYGFYKSSYTDERGDTRYLLTTFFSPVHARKAFPCFDEPSMKATFDFSFKVPSGFNVLFNTPVNSSSVDTNGFSTVIFNTTPKMSTFVLAFIVSEFTCTAGNYIGAVPYQVCSREESANLRDLALQFGPSLLASLNNYTAYDYGNVMDKMDQVAIPDFAANAMENWGLITYRETALLWDMTESSNYYKQQVITVIAHEFAHQWFGNLVTLNWWSAIFLKEGFARYFQYHTPHESIPEWQLDKQFVIEQVHSALLRDALENSHALESECYSPAEITSRFSTISYNKGASILRMVEHVLSKERFRSGIQHLIINHQFGNIVPEDIWISLNDYVLDSISYLPDNFTTAMKNWINLPGYPVLYVSINGREVTISQKRFLLSGEDDATSQWYVPISYSISLDPDKFGRTSPILWLTPNNTERFSLPTQAQWIILNNQQSGYYRVNYDNTLWNNIAAALLKSDFDGIGDLNRAQIVDDLFNLARAGQILYSRVFNIIQFLVGDTSYFSWYPAFSGFDFLLMRVGQDSFLGQSISATILQWMRNLYNSVPISTLNEEDQIYTLKQVLTNSWACRLGYDICVQHVQTLFNDYKTSGVRPNSNLRSIVYCNALRYSSDSSDWEFLWDAYKGASDLATEQVTILSALGCTKDETILKEYLNKSISEGSGIRTQDALSVFSSVYTGSSKGIDVAFDFLIENFEIIAERYNSMNSLGNLIRGIAERFTTEGQVNRLRDLIETGTLPEAFQASASEALETAETNLKWLENFEDDLFQFFDNGGFRSVSLSFWIISTLSFCLVLNNI